LGQLAHGIGVDQLSVGMEVELVTEVLYSDEGAEHLVWKWRPVNNNG
jgi:hypothetical protein